MVELSKKRTNRTKRIMTLDAARGLAVIGMFIQHFALNERNANIVSGNTLILFILCSGMSFTLMVESARKREVEEKIFRTRVLVRALFIDFLGYLLILLNGPFAVVLTAYAFLFLMALFLKNCSDKILFTVSIVTLFVSPLIMIVGMSLFKESAMLADIAGGPLSAVALVPVFSLGMLLGRQNFREVKRGISYVAIGIICVIAVKLMATYVLPNLRTTVENYMVTLPAYSSSAEIDMYAAWPKNTSPIMFHMLFTAGPNTGTMFAGILGTGVSLIIIGVCGIIENYIKVILIPFVKVGKAALSLYTLQIIIGWFLILIEIDFGIGDMIFGDILVAIITILFGYVFGLFGEAPVEKMLRKVETLFI